MGCDSRLPQIRSRGQRGQILPRVWSGSEDRKILHRVRRQNPGYGQILSRVRGKTVNSV
jgi:hypothetical protein